MAPQQSRFRPGSKTRWRKHLASVARYIDDLESRLARAGAPAPGSNESAALNGDCRDAVYKVTGKLAVLGDFFALYWAAWGRAGVRQDAIEGLSFIIADCAGELRKLVKPGAVQCATGETTH